MTENIAANSADGDFSHEIKRCLLLGRKAMTNLDNILKNRDITLPRKVCLVKIMVFPVVMHGCESWIKWKLSSEVLMFLNCGVGEYSESPLNYKEIHQVHPKGNQSWMFLRRTHSEAENPILWPPDGKSRLIGKDPAAWKDWSQEEKVMIEDERVGWYHQLNGHEFE